MEIKSVNRGLRREEIQQIIDRMPTNFGSVITIIVSVMVFAFITLGMIVRYPDVVTGTTTINSNNFPVKLVANLSGKIHLQNIKSSDHVKNGDYLAVISNSANTEDIVKVQSLLKKFTINALTHSVTLVDFPENISLGEVNVRYFTFLSAYSMLVSFKNENLYVKQEEVLLNLLKDYEEVIKISNNQLDINKQNLQIFDKFAKRDSLLYTKKVLSEIDNDRSELSYLNARENYQRILSEIVRAKTNYQETENKLQQNRIQKMERDKQLYLELVSAYTELVNYLKSWEERYVFKAPIEGTVQFMNFWQNNQYIEAGSNIFTILPNEHSIIAQMILPAIGAGKVKSGQEVILKLDNYPYAEFGSIKAIVKSISLISNPIKTDKGDLFTYLVNLELPDGLVTNYGLKLDFKYEIKGTGDIITNDRKLLERFFDKLKYSIKL